MNESEKEEREERYHFLQNLAKREGISLFGVGDVGDLLGKSEDLPPETIEDLTYGVSLGLRLSDRVIDGIEDRPTRLYLHHYRQANALLDHVALKVTSFIQKEGWCALPIPASQIVDWERQVGHLSHKISAVRAGLGWIGRSNLVVNPDYGSRIRYVTILTNMPLKTDSPLKADCGECRSCIEVCPAGAIREHLEDFDRQACLEKLRWFSKKYNIGQYICGICIKACRGPSYSKLEAYRDFPVCVNRP